MYLINKVLGYFNYFIKNHSKSIYYFSKTLRFEKKKVFISYSQKDKDIVLPFAIKALINNIPIYLDLIDRPTTDNHSLEVGLSEGLSNCHFLISFVSTNYLDSKWCRGELREFIFLHGKKMSRGEIEDLRKNNSISILSIDHQNHFQLPKIPVLIVVLDNNIDDDKISIAISPRGEDINHQLADGNHRMTVVRGGDEDQKQYDFSFDYVKRRGIDASNYIKHITKISAEKKLMNKFNEIIETIRGTKIQEAGENGSQNPDAVWNYIWMKYPYKTVAQDISISSLLNEFQVAKKDLYSRKLKKQVKKDDVLYKLFKAVNAGNTHIEMFDRAASENYTPAFLDQLICIIPKAKENFEDFVNQVEYAKEWHASNELRPRKITGNPIDIIVNKAQNEDILRSAQRTYYYLIERNICNALINIVFLSICIINIDMAFEKITDKNQIMELIIYPLNQGKDIRSRFPLKFRNISDLLENQYLRKLHEELVNRQSHRVKLHKIIKNLEKNNITKR